LIQNPSLKRSQKLSMIRSRDVVAVGDHVRKPIKHALCRLVGPRVSYAARCRKSLIGNTLEKTQKAANDETAILAAARVAPEALQPAH
jgi:hypothetical protein